MVGRELSRKLNIEPAVILGIYSQVKKIPPFPQTFLQKEERFAEFFVYLHRSPTEAHLWVGFEGREPIYREKRYLTLCA